MCRLHEPGHGLRLPGRGGPADGELIDRPAVDQPSIRQALARWERLTLFSNSLQNLVDQ